MTRIPPLARDEMEKDQQAILDRIAGDNGRIGFGPAIGYAYSAFVWDLHNVSSKHLLDCALTNAQVRIISLLTVKHWKAPYPWSAQSKTALGAGLSIDIVESINKGSVPAFGSEEDAAVYRTAKELLINGNLSDQGFEDATKTLGYKKMSEIVHTIGHFSATALMANMVGCTPPTEAVSLLEEN
jgi:hypothetical protein